LSAEEVKSAVDLQCPQWLHPRENQLNLKQLKRKTTISSRTPTLKVMSKIRKRPNLKQLELKKHVKDKTVSSRKF
jgi:hypothetical protein